MQSEAKRILPSIRMGEMEVCVSGSLRSLLGSCIGVAVFDRTSRAGGLAHVVLPSSNGDDESPGKYADTAIPLLVERVRRLTGKRSQLIAKIAGGANMFATSSAIQIGVQNLEAVRQSLDHLKIELQAEHCGGNKGRRMTANTETAEVVISIVGEEEIYL